MSIKPGTLCILIGDHIKAGQICTTISPLKKLLGVSFYSGMVIPEIGYIIDIFENNMHWLARSSQIRPLNDPDNAKDFQLCSSKPQTESVS